MFQKRVTPFACVLIALVTCALTFVAVTSLRSVNEQAKLNELRTDTASFDEYREVVEMLGPEADKYSKLCEMIDLLEAHSIRDYDESYYWENIYRALAISISDKYSQYLTGDEYDALINSNDGDFVGIGVHVAYDIDTEGVYIFGVIDGSPAQSAGLKAGDIIVAANGIRANNDSYYTILDTVRGEANTEVNLTVLRDGTEREVVVTRAPVASENVIYENLGDGIAYIRILSFSDSTVGTQFTKKIALAQQEGCKRFIFDVRNNSGGYLEEICKVLDLLLPEGKIINIVDKDGKTTVRYSDANCIESEGMVVLCNENTASAAELFSAALRDYKLATLVGTKTFGKGSMQTTYTLSDGSAFKLSTAFYNPPSNESYDGIGITPDKTVDLTDEWKNRFYKMPKEEDEQLKKAIELVASTN